MRILTVVFPSLDAFQSHYSEKYTNGALFCPTKAIATPRDKVVIDLYLPGQQQPARLKGQVLSISSGHGMWVHLDEQSAPTLEYLLSLSTNESSEHRSRSHSRYPTSLRVVCRIDETEAEIEKIDGEIVDLSSGGAFVAGDHLPLIGTRVSLDIGFAIIGSNQEEPQNHRIDGRVAWHAKSGSGFGVRFDRRGHFGAAPVRTMLRRASEAGEIKL